MFDRKAQVVFEQFAVRQVGVHRRVVDAGAIAAFVLGAIERHVGIAHDIGGAAVRAAIDDGDADAGADDDVVAADGIGRAQRRDDAVRGLLQGRRVGAERGNDREFVAAEPRHDILAAQGSAQPECDVADEFVADRMAERVVHVLEMIEIDIEHGRRRSAALDVLDHRLQALAEIIAVGQSAQRIVQREIAQAVLARGDGRGGAPHVSEDQRGEKGEAGERHGDEGNDALHDLGAGTFRRPGEARDRIAAFVGEIQRMIVRRDHFRAGFPQIAQLQAVRDFGQDFFVDEFDRQHDRRGLPFTGIGGFADRHDQDRGDDGGPAEKLLHQRHAGRRDLIGGVADSEMRMARSGFAPARPRT